MFPRLQHLRVTELMVSVTCLTYLKRLHYERTAQAGRTRGVIFTLKHESVLYCAAAVLLLCKRKLMGCCPEDTIKL